MSGPVSDVNVRLVRLTDAEAIARIYEPYVTDTAISFELEAPAPAEMHSRIERITAQYPWLVAETQGEVVGYAYASEHRTRRAYRWSVDVAIYVQQSQHRHGIGRALYRPLFELLRYQGYANTFAGITLPNDASVRLHEALGFMLVGIYRHVGYKHGEWRDVGWWQLSLGQILIDPSEPVPFPHLRAELVDRAIE